MRRRISWRPPPGWEATLPLPVEPGEISLERKFAAVGVLQPGAAVPQLRQQLENQRAGEPQGVEGVDAAHIERLLLQRRHHHATQPAAVALALRPGNARADVELHLRAFAGERRHLDRGDRVGHHGIDEPSWLKKRPESPLFRPAITWRKPLTEVSGVSGAPAPPMSVRTHPGLSATTAMRFAASVTARPLTSMLSAALLVAYGSVSPLDSAIEPRRLDIIAITLRSLAATLSTSASASAAAPSRLTRSTSSHDS